MKIKRCTWMILFFVLFGSILYTFTHLNLFMFRRKVNISSSDTALPFTEKRVPSPPLCPSEAQSETKKEDRELPSSLTDSSPDCSAYNHLNRNVYTYHQDLKGKNSSELIQLWEISWRKNCWVPTVLNEKDAFNHENYDFLHEKFQKLPTVNPKEYEMTCYRRYIAMATIKNGGIMVDTDVINMSFKPSDMTYPLPERFSCYDGAVPSLVYGSQSEWERVANYMSEYQLAPTDTYNGRPHISDMYIMEKMLRQNLVDNRRDESPFKTKKLLHLSARSVANIRRATKIKDLNKKDVSLIALLL